MVHEQSASRNRKWLPSSLKEIAALVGTPSSSSNCSVLLLLLLLLLQPRSSNPVCSDGPELQAKVALLEERVCATIELEGR